MTSTVADLLQTIEALSLTEQQELLIALFDRFLVIAHGPEDASWIESIRDKIDAAYASTEPSVDGSPSSSNNAPSTKADSKTCNAMP
jgi:hypothetical protein